MKSICLAGALWACIATSSLAGPIGPSPYLSSADNPWAGVSFSQFYREDFEDGDLNTPGVTAIGAELVQPAGGVFTDSVDGDDGAIDGSGTNGRSHYTSIGVNGIQYSFDAGVLGGLPTHAGLVWTDMSGLALVFFRAYDSAGIRLGEIDLGTPNDGLSTGQTAEDRFVGWESPAGISRIHILQRGSDMEVDHLQYGIAVPEPTTAVAALLLRRHSRGAARVRMNAAPLVVRIHAEHGNRRAADRCFAMDMNPAPIEVVIPHLPPRMKELDNCAPCRDRFRRGSAPCEDCSRRRPAPDWTRHPRRRAYAG
jgi:hypothetical protein